VTGGENPNSSESGILGEKLTSELALDFSQTARVLFEAGDVGETLNQVANLSVVTIEACDFAGIFLVKGGELETTAHTDPHVVEIDELQQHFGQGPCLDAVAHGITVYADELAGDPRWSEFGPEAVARGIRSVLAVPLLGDGSTVGALNLYARFRQAFGVVDRARGLLLAALGGLAASAARTHEHEARRAENLHAALGTRELIGQAQGILIERERITADQAFGILRQASQHLNIKLREVAQNLVDTGERPDVGTNDSP
jgi:GAF domain-containing protein